MKFLLNIVLLCCSISVFANDLSPKAAVISPRADKTLLTDIVKTNAGLVVVGKHGVILTSADGETWLQAAVPVQTLLTSVFFIDAEHGWATGHDATILATQDGGLTWQIQHNQPELDKPLLDILFKDKSNGIAIGAYGLFYRTRDGGMHWQSEFQTSLLFDEDKDFLAELKETNPEGYLNEIQAILPHLNQVNATKDQLIMVGEQGLLATSLDFGITWERLDEIYPGSFFDVKELINGDWLAAGLRGNVFLSTDQGENWQSLDNSSHATINKIIVTNTGALLLANNGVMVHYVENQLKVKQFHDAKALVSGAILGNKLVLASEVGIKLEELK